MTNAEIIFEKSMELMKAGLIGTTGMKCTATVIDENGHEKQVTVDEPEPIHTYSAWKEAGYQVRKGEKAIAKFIIWKHTSKHNEETDKDDEHMFMKMSAFFKASQVDPIAE